MIKSFLEDSQHIYIAVGPTDFRKQAKSLTSLVLSSFKLDPYDESYVFIFCNRKRDGIKVLRYDKNGFILAYKKLLDNMKFQWPRSSSEVKEITMQQITWLLQGLNIEQKKALKEIKISTNNSCF